MGLADYQWFVEPLDDFTNESIARALAEVSSIDTLVNIIDDKSVGHNLYRVEHKFITQLRKSQHAFNFRVYNRQGENGALRLWKFNKKKKSNKKDKKKK